MDLSRPAAPECPPPQPHPSSPAAWFYGFIVELISMEAQGCEIVFVWSWLGEEEARKAYIVPFFLESSFVVSECIPKPISISEGSCCRGWQGVAKCRVPAGSLVEHRPWFILSRCG